MKFWSAGRIDGIQWQAKKYVIPILLSTVCMLARSAPLDETEDRRLWDRRQSEDYNAVSIDINLAAPTSLTRGWSIPGIIPTYTGWLGLTGILTHYTSGLALHWHGPSEKLKGAFCRIFRYCLVVTINNFIAHEVCLDIIRRALAIPTMSSLRV